MIKIAIADDHPLMLEGVKKVLKREIDINVTGEALDGNEVIDMIRSGEQPDLLILDITMPGKSGIDLIKDIHELHPDLPILILSIHPEERFAVRALKAGAQGYINKSSIANELIKAVRIITEKNKKYISPEVAQQLASQVNDSGRPIHESLSDREFEVLCMIANGKEIDTIAERLNISPNTVHTYRSRVKKKMNLSSDVEMTRYALLNDLID